MGRPTGLWGMNTELQEDDTVKVNAGGGPEDDGFVLIRILSNA